VQSRRVFDRLSSLIAAPVNATKPELPLIKKATVALREISKA
jgi:hypothetical protein